MAEVVKATVGSGYLGGNQQTWWSWKVTWGDVWMFWVDTASHGAVKRVVEMRDRVVGAVDRERVLNEIVGPDRQKIELAREHAHPPVWYAHLVASARAALVVIETEHNGILHDVPCG